MTVSTAAELWKSDGTLDGTVLVKDIRAGAEGSIGYGYFRTRAASGGRLFLLANDAVHGNELWSSNGTETGTVLVKDLTTGNNGSYARYLTNIGDTLIFQAYDGIHGHELWKSDGTQTGTMLIKDINPARSPVFGYNSGLTKVDEAAFFRANDGVAGYELWKTDGTEAGTVLVKDINPTVSPYGDGFSSVPYQFTDVDGTLYFSADDGTNGRELWKSDGTEAGTVLVKDIRPGLHPVYLYPAELETKEPDER